MDAVYFFCNSALDRNKSIPNSISSQHFFACAACEVWALNGIGNVALCRFFEFDDDFHCFSEFFIWTSSRENTTIMLGNGAPFLASPNLSLPRTNRISEAFGRTMLWNHLVSVLAGRRNTAICASTARSKNGGMPRLYGGLQNTRRPVQGVNNGADPSAIVSPSGHGSKSKWNSLSRASYKAFGVGQCTVAELNSARFISFSSTRRTVGTLDRPLVSRRRCERVLFRGQLLGLSSGAQIPWPTLRARGRFSWLQHTFG